MSGHWIGKCWKVHPQLRPKRGKRVIQALAKKEEEDGGVSPMTIIPEEFFKKISYPRSIRLNGLVRNG